MPGIRMARAMVVRAALCAAACLTLPAAAHAADTAYVANAFSESVSQYAIGASGLLSPLSPATVPAATSICAPGPVDIALTPDGSSAYAIDFCFGLVNQYDVDPSSGALSPKTVATVDSGPGALGVAVTPDGRSAYVTSVSDGTVFQYDIAPTTGALSPKTPASVDAGFCSWGIAMSPDGASAYVVDDCDLPGGGVRQFNVDPITGALSPKTPPAVLAGRGPRSIAVSSDGRSAYVTNESAQNGTATGVSQYSIDPLSGALSPKSPATVATGPGPVGVDVTPDGRSAYVTSVGSASVFQYDIDRSTGALSAKAPPAVAAGGFPWDVAVTSDGRSAYVTNQTSGNVSQYDVNPSSGALSPKPSAPAAAGTQPEGIAIRPDRRAPTSKDQCKNGGWRTFGDAFKNQGECVAFVERGPKP
jgi:6-phosphogluconolactonase